MVGKPGRNAVKEYLQSFAPEEKPDFVIANVENTVFYITDKDNKVNNFLAQNIDETAPGSKIIKLTAPEGLI